MNANVNHADAKIFGFMLLINMIEHLDTSKKCECGNDAWYHSLTVSFGRKVEKHQCNSCAAKEESEKQNWDNFKYGDMK